jgi:hypothetical protein
LDIKLGKYEEFFPPALGDWGKRETNNPDEFAKIDFRWNPPFRLSPGRRYEGPYRDDHPEIENGAGEVQDAREKKPSFSPEP